MNSARNSQGTDHFRTGTSYREIAEQLRVTVNHVGVLLNRARVALRERLQAHRPTAAAERFPRELEL